MTFNEKTAVNFANGLRYTADEKIQSRHWFIWLCTQDKEECNDYGGGEGKNKTIAVLYITFIKCCNYLYICLNLRIKRD